MPLWNRLFGEKVIIEIEDENGNLVRKEIDKSKFDETIKSGQAVLGGKIRVHVLDAFHGYYVKEWEVGEDVEPSLVAQFGSPMGTPSRELYVMVVYENGKPTEMICRKDVWERQQKIADMIDRGEDYEPELRKHLDELKSEIKKKD